MVVLASFDRLGRETRLILNAVAEPEKHGVRVRSVTEEFDTGTASGRLMLTNHQLFAIPTRTHVECANRMDLPKRGSLRLALDGRAI